MTEHDKSLVRRLRQASDVIMTNLPGLGKSEAEAMAHTRAVFLECADTIESLEGDAHILASIKQMQANADDYVIITGAEATADQLEARVALCVKACANMNSDALEYIGNVRSEGLFRYKKRHEAIVTDLETKYEQLLERHDRLGTRYDAAYEDLLRYDTDYPPVDISEIITQEQAHELEMRVAELSEPWVDAHGTHWNPPTAWAYAQVCRVMNEQRSEIEQLSKREI
jgi:hypothetical protein